MQHSSSLKCLYKQLSKPGERPKVNVIRKQQSINSDYLIRAISEYLGVPVYRVVGRGRNLKLADELLDLANQLSEVFAIPPPNLTDWEQAIAETCKLVRKGDCVLFIDDIEILAGKHDDIADALWTWWEQWLKNATGFTLIFASADNTWLDEHITFSPGWYGRLSFAGAITEG
ncbi:AAA family ATPase [Agarivorans albus]|uniref:AAA family ATPase n=1 Tax=Agarivorans albus TaxID=182262 RepID=UPI00058C3093|nr:AAA family ATPase [Agarivorans albus]